MTLILYSAFQFSAANVFIVLSVQCNVHIELNDVELDTNAVLLPSSTSPSITIMK